MRGTQFFFSNLHSIPMRRNNVSVVDNISHVLIAWTLEPKYPLFLTSSAFSHLKRVVISKIIIAIYL